MNFQWFIAQRFLQSQQRGGVLSFITLFSIIGIALGTAALIISLSILSGFEKEIKEKVVAFVTHIQIQNIKGGALPHNPALVQETAGEIEGIKSISPFVAREGMIRSKGSVDGVFVKGIDTQGQHEVLQRYLIAGNFLSASQGTTKEIIVGKKLALKMALNVGDSVVVFGTAGDNPGNLSPRIMKLAVVGIYESGMSEYDDIYAFTSFENAQKLFSLQGFVTGYDVMVNNLDRIDEIAQQITEKMGYRYYARTMYKIYRNLFAWIDFQKELSPILLFLILAVATVNILGTLLMFVVEKVKAIGILATLGATSSHLQKIFFYQGIAISSVGIVLGNLLGFALCYVQSEFNLISIPSDIYFMNSVPIELKLSNFALVSAGAFILSLITTYLPSKAAAKVEPVSAMRFS